MTLHAKTDFTLTLTASVPLLRPQTDAQTTCTSFMRNTVWDEAPEMNAWDLRTWALARAQPTVAIWRLEEFWIVHANLLEEHTLELVQMQS